DRRACDSPVSGVGFTQMRRGDSCMTQGAAEDLWHLSSDALFVAPVEPPPLEGPGPFVINLSASTAPISISPPGLAGFEKFKLYQVSRKEDGRDRFRLRLGFFDTPASVNEALALLPDPHPTAFPLTTP